MPVELGATAIGSSIKCSFIVLRKEKKNTRNGKPYCDLLLGHKTGEIAAKIWDLTDDLLASFEKESVVEVSGTLDQFNNQPQIKVESIRALDAADINYEDFLPSSRHGIGELKAQLFSIIESVQDTYLKSLLYRIFSHGPDGAESTCNFTDVENANSENEQDCTQSQNGKNDRSGRVLELFLKAPAAKNFHHAYLGGLAEHTIGVAKLCDVIAGNYPGLVNRSLLIAGALLHDIGKIREFSYLRMIDYSTEGRLIGHHVLGYEMIKQAADSLVDNPNRTEDSITGADSISVGFVKTATDTENAYKETIMQLTHLILSHHGSYENQSPRKPKTIEALLLHLCDDADAKINAFQMVGEEVNGDADWSPYNRVLERFVYLRKLEEKDVPETLSENIFKQDDGPAIESF